MAGAVAACQAARVAAGASRPGKPASSAPVAIAPWVGELKPSSTISAIPTGTDTRAPRRRAGPGCPGPIEKSGDACSRRAVPDALKSLLDALSGDTGRSVTRAEIARVEASSGKCVARVSA